MSNFKVKDSILLKKVGEKWERCNCRRLIAPDVVIFCSDYCQFFNENKLPLVDDKKKYVRLTCTGSNVDLELSLSE